MVKCTSRVASSVRSAACRDQMVGIGLEEMIWRLLESLAGRQTCHVSLSLGAMYRHSAQAAADNVTAGRESCSFSRIAKQAGFSGRNWRREWESAKSFFVFLP